jgi:hypothetical protein
LKTKTKISQKKKKKTKTKKKKITDKRIEIKPFPPHIQVKEKGKLMKCRYSSDSLGMFGLLSLNL